MQKERNCWNQNPQEINEDSFPLFDLKGNNGIYECPTSAIPGDIWDVIDLFWLCHSRAPGFSSWVVHRNNYPYLGGALEQDSWIMWAFGTIETEFYSLQNDLEEERENKKELEETHRKITRHAPR